MRIKTSLLGEELSYKDQRIIYVINVNVKYLASIAILGWTLQ
jgi:uncharacterized membrane protein